MFQPCIVVNILVIRCIAITFIESIHNELMMNDDYKLIIILNHAYQNEYLP